MWGKWDSPPSLILNIFTIWTKWVTTPNVCAIYPNSMIYPPLPFYALCPFLSGVILSFNTKCLVMARTTLIPCWSKSLETFSWHSYVYVLEKQHENLNFYGFIISRRIVGGNFQGNACSNFQKICIWTRHDHSTFIRETSSILVAVLRVCLIIISEMLIFEEFSPLKSPLLTTLSKTRALTSRKCFAEAT